MAQPFDAQAKARFTALIDRGRQPRLAAEDIGFTWDTVARHLKNDPEFQTAVYDASKRLDEHVVEVVLDQALDGNLAAARMWLQERGRATGEWQEAKQLQVTGAGGGPIQLAVGSAEGLRSMFESPDSRQNMLEMARQIPALGAASEVIEATAVERG